MIINKLKNNFIKFYIFIKKNLNVYKRNLKFKNWGLGIGDWAQSPKRFK